MKKINSVYVSVTALALATVAIVMCVICCCKGGSSVEQALKDKPELVIQAMQNYDAKMREQAMAKAEESIKSNLEDINNNPDSAVMGNPNGEVVLVEFFDFSCGYCHRIYPVMKNIIRNNSNVKFVTKELAFVSPASLYAAKAAHAAKEQGKYVEMYDALFSLQGLDEPKVDAAAAKIGLDMAKFKADVASDKINAIVQANSDLAQKIQISGVPTLVLNGKMLQTIDENVIQEAIDAAK